MANATIRKRLARLEAQHGTDDGLLDWMDVFHRDTPAAIRRRERHPLYWKTTADALEWRARLIETAASPNAPDHEREFARRTLAELNDPTPPAELRAMAAIHRKTAQALEQKRQRGKL